MADAHRLMAELQQTAGELQRELSALASASERMVPITVKDDKGAVALTLAANGGVQSLELDEDWRETIGEEGLGLVVGSCYQDALAQRTGEWMKSYAENAEQDAADAEVSIAAPQPVELGGPRSSWALEEREKLREVYAAAEAEQQDYVNRRAQLARQTRDATTSSKAVTITRQGSTITAVTLDERWLRNTDDAVIEQEIVRAMNSVMAMADRDRENRYDGFPAIEQLAKIANDPRGLMRRMGAIR